MESVPCAQSELQESCDPMAARVNPAFTPPPTRQHIRSACDTGGFLCAAAKGAKCQEPTLPRCGNKRAVAQYRGIARGKKKHSRRMRRAGRLVPQKLLLGGRHENFPAERLQALPCSDKRDELAPRHSMISVAMSRRLSGTSIPRSRAVFRLMPKVNLVGACTGKSPGLVPLRMRST